MRNWFAGAHMLASVLAPSRRVFILPGGHTEVASVTQVPSVHSLRTEPSLTLITRWSLLSTP